MDNKSFNGQWPSKRKIGQVVGSASLALLFVSQIISGSKRDENRDSISTSESDAQKEQSGLNQPQPAAFTPSVTIQGEDGVAGMAGLTISAAFIGMSGEVAMFADLIVARNGVRVASYRTLVGGSFELPIGDNRWYHLTVEEIKFQPSAAGLPSEPPNVVLSIKSTATHSVKQSNAPSHDAHIN